MLIRPEQSFIESVEKLNDKFSEQDREELSQRTGMLNQALKLARDKSLRRTDYQMIATDDTIYPSDYAQK